MTLIIFEDKYFRYKSSGLALRLQNAFYLLHMAYNVINEEPKRVS